MYREQTQTGFTLIEVLISMFIFGLGALGVLSLLLNGMKYTSSSNARTVASQAMQDMAEMLRTNPSAIGSNATATKTFNTAAPSLAGACMDNTTLVGTCDRNAFIAFSIQAWRNNLAATLPGGVGTVCRDSAPVANDATIRPPTWTCNGNGAYIVKVCWNESRVAASASNAFGGGMICTWTHV